MQFEDYNYTVGRDNKMGQESFNSSANGVVCPMPELLIFHTPSAQSAHSSNVISDALIKELEIQLKALGLKAKEIKEIKETAIGGEKE